MFSGTCRDNGRSSGDPLSSLVPAECPLHTWPIFYSKSQSVNLLVTPTLCKPINYSLPGSSVHGILQAIILEWVAMLSSP